ncbi:hypothetical protein DRF62_18620 [Chryseobacterium piscium]|uniref:Uncharacterized protein n=1 Tax=Chryseobacterium piscium TaxID=333702 RepID=A0A3D9BBI5_9FLAO|nr:hypothetical protein [Chryseobacterium piscium]REC50809.1 hypothetical protein DRF62_18620 [Chryseobacterium piscium]
MTKEELEQRNRIHEEESKIFTDAQKVFEILHPDTRMQIVSKDKFMYSVMSSREPIVQTRFVSNSEAGKPSYEKFLEFKKIYDPKFLEIKTKEDFKRQTKDIQQHFKNHFPGEFSGIKF